MNPKILELVLSEAGDKRLSKTNFQRDGLGFVTGVHNPFGEVALAGATLNSVLSGQVRAMNDALAALQALNREIENNGLLSQQGKDEQRRAKSAPLFPAGKNPSDSYLMAVAERANAVFDTLARPVKLEPPLAVEMRAILRAMGEAQRFEAVCTDGVAYAALVGAESPLLCPVSAALLERAMAQHILHIAAPSELEMLAAAHALPEMVDANRALFATLWVRNGGRTPTSSVG